MKIQKISTVRQQNFGDTILLVPESRANLSTIRRLKSIKEDSPFRTEYMSDPKGVRLLLSDGTEQAILAHAEVNMYDKVLNHNGHCTGVYVDTLDRFVAETIEKGKVVTVKTLEDVRKLPKWGEIVKYMM